MPPIWNIESDVLNAFAVGTIVPFASETLPDEYLECDGSPILRATYSTLFSVIGETWGAGDGLTTFNLPDLRGHFLRAWDHARGVDVGRVFASVQDHQTNEWGVMTESGGSGLASGGSYSFKVSSTWRETRPKNYAVIYCIKY